MSAPAVPASQPGANALMPATAGWFYVDPEKFARMSTGGAVEAKDEALVDAPALVPRFVKKFGLEGAAARAAATSIAGMRSQTKSKNGKGKGKNFKAVVFNPQASRPQPVLHTPLQEFNVCGEFVSTFFTTSTSIPVYAAEAYTLSTHFPDSSSYTSLFDEYRVNSIEVWLEPSIIMSPTVGSTPFYSAVDLDDANVPGGAADVAGRQGAIESLTGTGHYHKWVPHVATALYSGAFTSYGSVSSMWIDCASPSVQHFGIKIATNAADGLVRAYTRTVRMSVTFRGPAI